MTLITATPHILTLSVVWGISAFERMANAETGALALHTYAHTACRHVVMQHGNSGDETQHSGDETQHSGDATLQQ